MDTDFKKSLPVNFQANWCYMYFMKYLIRFSNYLKSLKLMGRDIMKSLKLMGRDFMKSLTLMGRDFMKSLKLMARNFLNTS